jgi:hypothetical protein
MKSFLNSHKQQFINHLHLIVYFFSENLKVIFSDLFEKISEEFSFDQITNQPLSIREIKFCQKNNDFDSYSFEQ